MIKLNIENMITNVFYKQSDPTLSYCCNYTPESIDEETGKTTPEFWTIYESKLIDEEWQQWETIKYCYSESKAFREMKSLIK